MNPNGGKAARHEVNGREVREVSRTGPGQGIGWWAGYHLPSGTLSQGTDPVWEPITYNEVRNTRTS